MHFARPYIPLLAFYKLHHHILWKIITFSEISIGTILNNFSASSSANVEQRAHVFYFLAIDFRFRNSNAVVVWTKIGLVRSERIDESLHLRYRLRANGIQMENGKSLFRHEWQVTRNSHYALLYVCDELKLSFQLIMTKKGKNSESKRIMFRRKWRQCEFLICEQAANAIDIGSIEVDISIPDETILILYAYSFESLNHFIFQMKQKLRENSFFFALSLAVGFKFV